MVLKPIVLGFYSIVVFLDGSIVYRDIYQSYEKERNNSGKG